MNNQMIMRRVYLIYWWRRITNPIVFKVGSLLGILALELTCISLHHVMENVHNVHGFTALSSYFAQAFTKTELVVQALVVATILLMTIIARDIARSARERISFPFAFFIFK